MLELQLSSESLPTIILPATLIYMTGRVKRMGRVTIYSPTAILGYGYPQESLREAIDHGVDYIGVDAGSTDPGPYYLGSGKPLVPDGQVYRDLRGLIKASVKLGSPLIIGSAGGAGAKPHVDKVLELTVKAASIVSQLRIAVIYSDVKPSTFMKYIIEGRVAGPADPGAPAINSDKLQSSVIVAQNGVEPLLRVLKEWSPDIVVAGRVADAAIFAAPLILEGVDKGLAVLTGKILECGAIAADPASGSDGMIAYIEGDTVYFTPSNPERRATVHSIAEHALYERSDPYKEYIPGGYADLSSVRYKQIDERTVAVSGAKWVNSDKYLVKIEGAGLAGYRAITIAGAVDPDFISRLDDLIAEAIHRVKTRVNPTVEVYVRVYGRDAVLGWWKKQQVIPDEIGLLVEAVAPDPNDAVEAIAVVRSFLLHAGWPGRKSTAGNLAFPLSPSDVYLGEAYEWTVWHLVEPPDPLALAHARLVEVRSKNSLRVIESW